MSIHDRRDGKMVKNVDGVHSLIPFMKPKRCDSDVYINYTFDVTKLVEYMEKKKKEDSSLTYFHIFSTAIAKLVYNRPLLNRFVINKRYYDRNNVSLSFVAKQEFNDTSEEMLSVIRINPEDDLFSVSNKIKGVVKGIRHSTRQNTTNNVINVLGKLPKLLEGIIWKTIKCLDNHDLLPSSLTENSIYHSSVLLSNLGSIDCDSIYHNLTDFGTNSVLITIGRIKDKSEIAEKGKKRIRRNYWWRF